jgi:DNA end-binding protein Ku
MAPPRPYWKGYLKLSLVSCPIAVYSSASSSERVAFRQINKQTGNRLKQQLIDEDTGDVVEAADKGRGYETGRHEYMMVEDNELDAIAIESNHTLEIDSFVPRAQIDERYLDSPYYLVPDDKVGQDAFAVIRDAMRGKDMVALGRIVLAKRERVMMLQAWDRGLLGTTLRYASEVRDPAAYFGDLPDIQVPADMLQLAEHILDSKTADFDPSQFKDRYEEAVVEMLKRKQAGMPTSTEQPAFRGKSNVVDLMEALKRSLANAPTPKEAVKPKKAKPSKRIEGQREMLPPALVKASKTVAEAPATTTKPRKTSTGRRAG